MESPFDLLACDQTRTPLHHGNFGGPIVNQLPLESIEPGSYDLVVNVVDQISNKTLVTKTPFKVNPF